MSDRVHRDRDRHRTSRNRSRRCETEGRSRRARDFERTPSEPRNIRDDRDFTQAFNSLLNRISAIENSMSKSGENNTVVKDTSSEISVCTNANNNNVASVNRADNVVVAQPERDTPFSLPTRNSADSNSAARVNRADDVMIVSPQQETTVSASTSAQGLVQAIKSLRSNSHDYFVSNFDPSLHNFDNWCEEVERAKLTNGWNDHECLSRVLNCLKGDAKHWLNNWAPNDRCWRKFVEEFKPLCPNRLDYANILYEVMNTNSDKFPTYADYARRALLRLRVIKGLDESLTVQIVIRGITDPSIRAAATNANLTCNDLVSFLSIYVKPNHNKQDRNFGTNLARKRSYNDQSRSNTRIKCFTCGLPGHKRGHNDCPKKTKVDDQNDHNPNSTGSGSSGRGSRSNKAWCTFCKKPNHTENECFAKNRSETRNDRKVNLCMEQPRIKRENNDLTTAVIQGIPVDVLIDSGALNVSLISSDVLKYFSCALKPVNCTIKGIGSQEITADSYVTLTVEFSEIAIEADFVVVPAQYMNSPIIIGTDILNRDGVTYVRTKNNQYLTRTTGNPKHVGTVDQQLCVNSPVEGTHRDSLISVLEEFKDFLISGTASTTVKTGKMHINLTDETPVAYRPYKLSHQEKLKVREIIKDLLDKGVIRESQSQYSSPIILVKKKDGSDRMCVDYRALNRLTIKDRYPMPLIDDHIDRLGKFKFFTSLDMATGFHQIPIDENSIHKTGFVTPEGHYEYVKMPFGLTNSPIVYQRIINNTLRKFIDAGSVLVYVDDVLIVSSTVDEGINLLRQVLQTLTDAGFSINLRKCSFLTTEVEYLGRVISQGQVRPSPHKIEALVKSSPPANVKQVRQFLGLAGYFRRYIEGYAVKTACIARLTKKDVPFHWGPEQEKVRQDIIQVLTTEPVLAIFDPELPTEVHCDASSHGYGSVLMQTHRDGKKRVVAYFSKSTQGAESRYHSYELETLAVVKALQHFRHYLVGIQFKVITDCNALKATERKKDLLPRVARWWIYLQDFTFEINYRKGSMMSHADYLSRNPTAEVNSLTRPRNWAQMAQAADQETQQLVEQLQAGQLDPRRYVYQNDTLYYRYSPLGEEARLLCYIPKGHRLSLLRVFHDEHEHIGAEKTLDLILKHFWFPGLRQFVAKYVAHCVICISNKRVPRAPHQQITSWRKPEVPFETLHIDALGPLPVSHGYKFVLLVVDAFTKYCLLYPIVRQDAEELKRAASNAISLFGVPKLLVVDRGRMFEARSFVQWISEMGCEMHYITPEMHNSNGQVERYVRTLLNMIRIETNHKSASWSDTLWRLQLVLNTTKQKTTQASPLNLLVGIDGATPVIRSLVRDVAAESTGPDRAAWREICRTRASELLRRNQSRQDSYVNQKRRPPRVFQTGDMVFVIKYSQSTGKLDPGMRGPYRVLKTLPSGRYELKLLSGSYGKTTQAAAEYMVPWRGEWCPDACAAFFECEFYLLVTLLWWS